ncbi:polysaccharide lyase family 7 protein [Streptomyces phyllanthi]|uniref:Polysaccharide lyase family 7 protein n=1 Tax=Streptomyces phyllanthi TaxID=1803180 RepID=A0A5N8W4D6_9ACTN|nr:polysaccharide lyase family 7 protein [Streptomyces phyllanthi]MPY41746.1 polysaccharide lyase family 7 protein [Streptomyces phyllanthi]
MRRRTLLGGGAAAGLGLAGWGVAGAPQAQASPIGTGWTEVNPGFALQTPPGTTRYEYLSATGEHHLWLLDSDPWLWPDSSSGPRSEMRWRNDYTGGQAQFECDMKIASGAHRVSVFQIFGGTDWATALMTLAMNTNSINYYDTTTQIHTPVYNTYIRLNVVHETGTGSIHVFVNRTFVRTFQDHGAGTHYFKAGLYGRDGMSARSDIYLKNVHLYTK